MAKQEADYRVYGTDTDGSQRLWGIVSAKSAGHAVAIMRRQGPIKQPVAELDIKR